jgi:hypothetical protein
MPDIRGPTPSQPGMPTYQTAPALVRRSTDQRSKMPWPIASLSWGLSLDLAYRLPFMRYRLRSKLVGWALGDEHPALRSYVLYDAFVGMQRS